MRLSRFFIDAPLSLGEHELPEAQAHYIGRVLRMATGDKVQLFDGSGQEFLGTLLEVGKKRSASPSTNSSPANPTRRWPSIWARACPVASEWIGRSRRPPNWA